MTENDLRPKIVKWLHSIGYEDAHECYTFNYCDVVGFKFCNRKGRKIPELKSIVTIELKINDIKGVMSQCRSHRKKSNYVYAAMPDEKVEKMKYETIRKFQEQGIGLISVGNWVKIRVESLSYLVELSKYKKILWRWHKNNLKKAPAASERD